MRTLSRRREEYVGEWLPKRRSRAPMFAEDVELAESVSIAMLTRAGNTRTHGARGVRALPGFRHAARGDRPGRREVQAAVRRIALRAREHAARRPRLQVSPSEQQVYLACC